MCHVNAVIVAALIATVPAPLQAQRPAPHSWQFLRVELGYSDWYHGGGAGVGGMFKFVHALGQNPTIALDAGIIAAKQLPDADFVIGVDGGLELRLRLASSLRLLVGGGAGVDFMVGEYLGTHARLSSGVEVALEQSPFTLRGTVHTGIPPFDQRKAIYSMVLVGAECRLSQRQ